MKSYYSIMFTPIRPVINEQVSIALLMVDNKNMFFSYSPEKLSFLNKLIPNDSVKFLRNYLNGINKDIKRFQNEINNDEVLVKKSPGYYFSYSEKYLNYLHSYSNNLITFSKPSEISIETNADNFKSLFEKYISTANELKPDDNSFNSLVLARDKLYAKISKKVNLDIEIDKISIPEIANKKAVLPDTINIFGKNGNYISGQFFDFNKQFFYLKADFNSYFNFVNFVNNNNNNNHFIIGDEPLSVNEKNHSLWNEIRNFSGIKYLILDEIEEIEHYIINNNVKPVFDDK